MTFFMFGCRFGPMEHVYDYRAEIEAFEAACLNCYQLYARTDKNSPMEIRDFGDAVIATC